MILKTDLMPHQRTAVEKIEGIRVGALFMEMGTGKTRTAIELIHRRGGKIGNVVWFCPVSLKETVRQEIIKHTDTAHDDIHVFGAKTNPRKIPAVFWHVVGIESMSSSKRIIFSANRIITQNSLVIVDESSYIKGHRSARTHWITYISQKARYRMILTGTPISQGVVDLYAQMRFLSPKILGYNSFYSFAANHLEYSEKYPDLIVRSLNTDYIAAKIKPYVYQVTKEECLDLPEKLYDCRYFEMSLDQKDYYEWAKEEILLDLDPDKFDSVTIFRLFSALQQITCGFWNRISERNPGMIEINRKRLNVLLDVIDEIPESEKVIIWAKYNYDIEHIGDALEARFGDRSVAYFYGKLKEKDRQDQVEHFRKKARFFLATPSCGGHGLTLNEASYVIFYNNSFKYSERLQAEDRCHRIGQTRPVTYIDIICSGSIDERIDAALASKGNAVEAFKREVDKVKNIREMVMSL
jgi:SNF2 family DNA or RNA helicase